MKKHPLRYGVTSVLISILFFIAAIVGFYHIIFTKFPAIQLPAHESGAYNDGFVFGKYLAFYVAPFFQTLVGWLLFKFGREKLLLAQTEEGSDSSE